MKNLNKMLSLILSVVMVLSLSVVAFAADTYSITINNSNSGHTYKAYQIFAGDLSGKTLSNITWGTGVSSAGQTALDDADVKAATLSDEAAAKAFAEEVAPYLTGTPASTSTVTDGKYVISGLEAGYYLVKDDESSLQGTNDAATSYILKVAADVEVTPKSSTPTVEKKVKDINDTEDSDIADNDWQDSADFDIGDNVPFKLTATIGDIADYSTYKLVFHDTLSSGLTYNNDAVVKVGGTAIDSSNYDITSAGTALTITVKDVKALGATAGTEVTVEYSAQLNESAVIGSAGNPNKVYLEYSNNPNYDSSKDTDNDGTDDDGDEDTTGETPEDTVIVFTYKVVINKVKSDSSALEGAGFTLYKKNSAGTYDVVKAFTAGADTTFTFAGLDDGEYKLVESETPSGYNTMSDVVFTITSTHDVTSDSPALTALNGAAVSGTISFTSNLTDGSLTADVVNYTGTELPSTGGMGTKVIYVLGGALVLLASVLLITKRRMGSER